VDEFQVVASVMAACFITTFTLRFGITRADMSQQKESRLHQLFHFGIVIQVFSASHDASLS